MNEDILWIFKVIFVMFCLWFIWGGPARLAQEAAEKKPTTKKQTISNTYKPAIYSQTIILR
jgi:hypothetical protein